MNRKFFHHDMFAEGNAMCNRLDPLSAADEVPPYLSSAIARYPEADAQLPPCL
ncbi:UNVERIFIED_CONTAM: hypothetical protein Sradi_5525300 [Sesamum radiatum]|uniref:Uncharacterized protein n=1 Tax=Sesamum radiatum TaxID=300843 RepID=A0AAW2LBR5_SESRA